MAIVGKLLGEEIYAKTVDQDERVFITEEFLIDNNFKKFDEPNYINNLFRNLAREKNILILIHYDQEHIPAYLNFPDLKANQIIIRTNSIKLDIRKFVKVSLVYKDELIFFKSKIKETIDNYLYKLEKPYMVFSSLRRFISRYQVGENEKINLQFSDDGSIYQIADLTTKGLSFLSKTIFLPEENNTKSVYIRIKEKEIVAEGKIKYCKKQKDGLYSVGMSFQNLSWEDYYYLFSYIFAKNYPHLKYLSDFTAGEIYKLFEEAGYLGSKSKDEMDEMFQDLYKNISAIKNKTQISINPVFYKDGKLLSTASLLRVYDRTFLGHQLASAPEARLIPKSKLDIYLGFSDILLNHPYFEYYLSYIPDLPWHREMFQKIGEIISDKNKFLLDLIQYFEFNLNEYSENKNLWNSNCEVLERVDEFVDFFTKENEPIIVNSYSYSVNNFFLPEIKQAYELLGLYSNRKLWRIKKNKRVVAYIVAEVYSNGLNLFNVLDMGRIYYVDHSESNIEYIINEMIPHLAAYYKSYNKQKFNIMFKCSNELAKELNLSGLRYQYQLRRIFISKAGVAEYKKFVAIGFR